MEDIVNKFATLFGKLYFDNKKVGLNAPAMLAAYGRLQS